MSDDKTEISSQTLGRYRAEVQTVKESDLDIIKSMGFESIDDAVTATYKSIALRAKTTVEDLTTQLDALTSRSSGGGVREADKSTRDKLIIETQDMLSSVNLAINSKRGHVKLTTQQKARVFDKLGESAEVLATHLLTSFSPVGGMSMFWNPQVQNSDSDDGLCVYVGGWEDASKNLRYQYAPRKCPVSKRSGYRDDSFQVPLLEVGKPTTPDTDPEKEKEPESPNTPEGDTES